MGTDTKASFGLDRNKEKKRVTGGCKVRFWDRVKWLWLPWHGIMKSWKNGLLKRSRVFRVQGLIRNYSRNHVMLNEIDYGRGFINFQLSILNNPRIITIVSDYLTKVRLAA